MKQFFIPLLLFFFTANLAQVQAAQADDHQLTRLGNDVTSDKGTIFLRTATDGVILGIEIRDDDGTTQFFTLNKIREGAVVKSRGVPMVTIQAKNFDSQTGGELDVACSLNKKTAHLKISKESGSWSLINRATGKLVKNLELTISLEMGWKGIRANGAKALKLSREFSSPEREAPLFASQKLEKKGTGAFLVAGLVEAPVPAPETAIAAD